MNSPSRATPIRVGLIGVGNWARHGHLRVLNLLPDYEVTAVYARRSEAAEAAAREFGIAHVLSSPEEVARHPEVDLVAVLTTAPQHEEGIRAAIEAGKHVYSEWPLTPSTTLTQQLFDLATERRVRTMSGLQRRLAPFNRYVGDLLREGFIGDLRSARIHVSMNYFQPMLPKSLAWTAPPENFSSMVAIYVGHYLDMLFEAAGWPDSVQALAVNQFPQVTIIETGEVISTTNADEFVLAGTLPGGGVVTAHFEGGKHNGSGVQIDLTGTAGDLRITNESAFGDVGDDYQIVGAKGDGQSLSPMPVPEKYLTLPEAGLPSAVMELAENYAAFARDLREGTTTAPTFAAAIRMHKLIDAALKASATGTRVALNW